MEIKIIKCGECKFGQHIDKVDFPGNIHCSRFGIQTMSYDDCHRPHLIIPKKTPIDYDDLGQPIYEILEEPEE